MSRVFGSLSASSRAAIPREGLAVALSPLRQQRRLPCSLAARLPRRSAEGPPPRAVPPGRNGVRSLAAPAADAEAWTREDPGPPHPCGASRRIAHGFSTLPPGALRNGLSPHALPAPGSGPSVTKSPIRLAAPDAVANEGAHYATKAHDAVTPRQPPPGRTAHHPDLRSPETRQRWRPVTADLRNQPGRRQTAGFSEDGACGKPADIREASKN